MKGLAKAVQLKRMVKECSGCARECTSKGSTIKWIVKDHKHATGIYRLRVQDEYHARWRGIKEFLVTLFYQPISNLHCLHQPHPSENSYPSWGLMATWADHQLRAHIVYEWVETMRKRRVGVMVTKLLVVLSENTTSFWRSRTSQMLIRLVRIWLKHNR